MNHQEIFMRYLGAGAAKDADAQAALFTPDGIYEAPLLPPGSPLPRRLQGQDQLREGFAAYHRAAPDDTGKPDPTRSGLVLHSTTDPDVFIAELDAVLTDGAETTEMSLAQIYRLQNGKIAHLRDYFTP
jgi:ketosteroid isomerase-like protein